MNRRNFLEKIRGKQAEVVPLHSAKNDTYDGSVDATAMNPFANWSGDTYAAQHLLRRVMFGAPAATINAFKAKTLDQAVADLLNASADPPPTAPNDFFTQAYHTQFQADLEAGITPAWLQVDPLPPVNDYDYSAVNNQGDPVSFDDAYVPKGMTWAASFDHFGNGTYRVLRRLSFLGWWGKLMLEQDNNIREKMTFFWHNHFAIRDDANNFRARRYWNNALLRHHALGNFKTLMKAITFDPQMMMMLDLHSIGANNAPNINYAREFFELFSLGYDAESSGSASGSSFTEDDMNALSRILSGYVFKSGTTVQVVNEDGTTSNRTQYSSYLTYDFNPSRHNTADKQFSSFFENAVITGRSGTAGQDEFDDFLDMYFDKLGLEIGQFVASEIYRFFVRASFAYKPNSSNSQEDEDIFTHVITPMANVFVDNNYEIKPMMEALLKSQHFFDDCHRGNMIKSPIDYFVGACRDFSVFPGTYLNADGSNTTDVSVQRAAYTGVLQMAAVCHQLIDDPQEVYGWSAYYQTPFDKAWIGSSFYKRPLYSNEIVQPTGCNLAFAVRDLSWFKAYLDSSNSGWRMQELDLITFVDDNVSSPSVSQTLVDELCTLFFTIPIRPLVKDKLALILAGDMGDYVWGSVWSDAIANPTDTTISNEVLRRLRKLFEAFFSMEEYNII